MLYLQEFTRKQNNLEARTQNKAFNLRFELQGGPGRRPDDQGDTILQDGDTLVLGTLPGGSVITKCYIDFSNGFTDGTTIDIGITQDENGASPTPIATGLAVGPSLTDKILHLPLPVGDNVDDTGTALPSGDPLNVLRVGGRTIQKTHYLIVTIHNTSYTLGRGDCDIMIEYNNFITNVGAY